ncbi:MAG: VIT1/CCC1 transporter family protein [Acidimicrobiales bacterium]
MEEPALDPASIAPTPEHHHRDVRGGGARAAVFGVSDGLVSNVGLILGVAGADAPASVVRVAGLAGLIAGAISMAAGEYNSMRVQTELFERELEMERIELGRNPHVETVELAQIYQSRGVDPDRARELAQEMMRDPEIALQTHAREELGIDPDSLGSPWQAAVSSLVAFMIGALVPLLPWFVIGHGGAILLSLGLAVAAAVVVGVLTARFIERPSAMVVGRQVLFTVVPAAITFVVGNLVGASV